MKVKKLEKEKRLEAIVDQNLNQNYNMLEVEMMIKVALLCTQRSRKDRPTMSEVMIMLEGEGHAERWGKWQSVEATSRQDYDRLQRTFAMIGNEEDLTGTKSLSTIIELSSEG
ncbi:hypothetical protein CTI12_AA149040 [Artemisia annua]|uniref:Uncharacterized protein n=1 Tax=Artemisia annua TaxID=35608 RepID=A0A2U1PG57_ARTAN|nr:hypothetical protein CTI12_AA149040 [Artemisia annua]